MIQLQLEIKILLPTLITQGNWITIRTGHQLIAVADDRVLDWEPNTGDYRVWRYSATAQDLIDLNVGDCGDSWLSDLADPIFNTSVSTE